MLCMGKRSDETWRHYRRRQNKVLRRVLSKMGCQELAARLLVKHYAWCGHVLRMKSDHIVKHWASTCTTEDWRMAQAIGQELDPTNTTGWRHRKRGPFVRWDSLMSNVMGDSWRLMAQDRCTWKQHRQYFIYAACNRLLGIGHRAFGVEAVDWP
eukprot:11642421-Karenia_brevis.AAC.1